MREMDGERITLCIPMHDKILPTWSTINPKFTLICGNKEVVMINSCRIVNDHVKTNIIC